MIKLVNFTTVTLVRLLHACQDDIRAGIDLDKAVVGDPLLQDDEAMGWGNRGLPASQIEQQSLSFSPPNKQSP